MGKLFALAAVAAVFLAGCKTQPALEPEVRSGQVGATVLEAEDAERYAIKTDLIKRGPVKTSILAHGLETTYEGTARALPFHEDYEFMFSQHDGKGTASMSDPAGVAPPN
jgi:hypothetical protein